LILAAVVRTVAYFISPQPCPPGNPKVTGVNIRSGRPLWSVRLPASLCNNQEGELLPYDNGFAIPAATGHVFVYRQERHPASN